MSVWPTTTEKSCNKVSRWVRFGQLLEVNFVQKLHISNHLPKRIFTKSCREGPSFVGCTFLIHSLFFPAFPSSFSDLPLLLSLFSWSISILFSLLRIHILSSSSSAFMLYLPTEQPISSSCTSCMPGLGTCNYWIAVQQGCRHATVSAPHSNSKRDHRRTRHFAWHNADIVEGALCWPSTCR